MNVGTEINPVPREQMSRIRLPLELATFAWGLPLLWLASILKVARERLNGGHSEIWVLPHRFDDFVCYWLRIRLLHTAAFFDAPDNRYFGSGWGYPAPPIWIYRFFYLFDPAHVERPYRGFAVMVILGLALTIWCAYKLYQSLQQRGLRRLSALGLTAVALVLSWPLLFVLQRGNVELLLWLPLAAGVFAYARRKWMLAAVLIGLTASFKLYPIILLALLLRGRRYKEIITAIVVAVVVTVVSLWYIGPSLYVAWKRIGLGVSGFIQGHGAQINWTTEGYNHSLFHLVKVNALNHQDQLGQLIPRYMVGIGIMMTAIFFTRVIRLPPPNQVMVLVISMIYLPATSYDYTLQVLFVPWAWLALIAVSRARRGERVPGMLAAMILFALVLGPELFLTTGSYIRSGTLKSVCLAILLIIAIVYKFDDPERPESIADTA